MLGSGKYYGGKKRTKRGKKGKLGGRIGRTLF